jgi:hypothetical protein
MDQPPQYQPDQERRSALWATDYVTFLDDDDRWIKGNMEAQYAVLEKHPHAAFAFRIASHRSGKARHHDRSFHLPDRPPAIPASTRSSRRSIEADLAMPAGAAASSLNHQTADLGISANSIGRQLYWASRSRISWFDSGFAA